MDTEEGAMKQSTAAILTALGERLRALRLRENITQKELAKRAGVSESTVKNAEAGKGITLASTVELLRALGRLPDLDPILRDSGPSPIELADRKGHARRRASRHQEGQDDGGEWTW